MAINSKLFKNGAYLQSSTTLFVFFASWGIWWSFFSSWLDKSLGLNGGQIGTIYSVNSLTTIAVLLFYGMTQDRLVLRRHLVILASSVMACLAPFAIFVYEPLLTNSFALGVVMGAIYLPFGYTAAVGLLEAFSERLSRTYGFDYGQARGWGSLGYAVAALFTGFIFTVNPHINFYLGSALGIVCLLVQVFWKTDKVPLAPGHTNHPHAPTLREIVSVLKFKHLWVVIGFVIFSWTFYNLYDNQMFPNFYRALFPNEDIGLHTICAVVTAEFLDHQRSIGNDLSTPMPQYRFPGLVPGDRWCVTARNWAIAFNDGVAAPVVLASTNQKVLELVPLEALRAHAVDVPDDLGDLEA